MPSREARVTARENRVGPNRNDTPPDRSLSRAATLPALRGGIKNALAPVLGGGRFTQPGADGGECSTQYL